MKHKLIQMFLMLSVLAFVIWCHDGLTDSFEANDTMAVIHCQSFRLNLS